MPPPIVVTLDGESLVIVAPYEALGLVHQIPVRRWDADRKVWIVPAESLPAVRKVLSPWIGGLLLDLETKPPADWAKAMFAAVPAQLHKPLHRAVAGVLHPDTGGDHRAMQALNSAYAEREKTA